MSLSPYLRLLRVHQWSKNFICFAGVIFSGNLLHTGNLLKAFGAFAAFLVASSAVYAINDVFDRHADGKHPLKNDRPLASGQVSIAAAITLAVLLVLAALGMAALSGKALLIALLIYWANNLLYNLWFKHLFLLDVLSIAVGFIIRLLAGIYVINELPTTWILLCTLFLSLFLGFGKRRAELRMLQAQSLSPDAYRAVFKHYTLPFLDTMLNNTALLSLITYALFTILTTKNPSLIISIPVVFYALFHYMHLLRERNSPHDPDVLLLTDRPLQISILVWLILFIAIFYGKLRLMNFMEI